ncbi:MAG: cytochrome c biogenesis protein CcsA [Deltaproteobacteria bacterium]|nr:cytochrome c biogenesis protein CcsA [Deltaproteobacteria bacterium]
MPAPKSTRFLAACAAAFALLLLACLAIGAAPPEATMGVVQKIFYFHVPSAWLLMLSALVSAGGSLAYLFRGSERGDRVALAAAELGVLFGLCVLVSGPLWAKAAWGAYWQWEARLTSSLLLWLMMVAYLLARRYGGPAARRLAAALALFAAVDIPLVYFSVRFFRSIHPQTTVVSTLGPGMRGAFWLSLAAFTGLWFVLLSVRLAAEKAQAEIVELEILLEQAEEEKS